MRRCASFHGVAAEVLRGHRGESGADVSESFEMRRSSAFRERSSHANAALSVSPRRLLRCMARNLALAVRASDPLMREACCMTLTDPDPRTEALHATMRHERLRTPLRFTDVNLPTIEHERLGRIWAPQLMTEMASLLALLGWQTRGGWRGHADVDWYLDSAAVRRVREPRPADDLVGAPEGYLEQVVRRYDAALLERARMAGHGWNGRRTLSDLELLAVLQHHGAATRLMDFTRNVWTALWFACREGPDRFGLLIGLELGSAFEVRDATTLGQPIADLVDAAGDRISMWRPSALSPRIPAQQGFFLWGPARFRPWGSIGVFTEAEPGEPQVSRRVPGFVCVAVPPELKHDMGLQWSSLFGFEQETLFPDLDGFARANGQSESLGPLRLWDDDADDLDADRVEPNEEDD